MYVRMLHIYVQNRNFHTRISYVLNEKKTKRKVLSVKWYILSANTVLI